LGSKKEFFKLLDKFGFERIRIRLTIEKGEITNLVFQYESYINEEWHEIIRYDLAHGFFHRDIIFPNGKKEKTSIEVENLKFAATYA
jgi:hypothetical protein